MALRLILGFLFFGLGVLMIFLFRKKDSFGLKVADPRLIAMFFIGCLMAICFISAKERVKYSTKYYYIKTTIKSQWEDNKLIKSDTLISIERK